MRAAATILGFLFLMPATAATALAQVPCSTVCSRYDQGQCVEHTHYSCDTAPPKPSYGAIAYGRESGAWGYSYQWGSQDKAESVALQNCAKNGGDCEVMVWFDRKCGAVAAGDGDNAFWGLGDGEGAARENAMQKCQAAGVKDCEVQVSHCSR